MHSTIRQLNGCANGRDESIVGTKGTANLDGEIFDLSGKSVWKYDGPTNNSLVQEHVDWVTAIRTGKPINTAKETALSTLMAIMGRDSAYTGKGITWTDLLASTNRLGHRNTRSAPSPSSRSRLSRASITGRRSIRPRASGPDRVRTLAIDAGAGDDFRLHLLLQL